MLFSLAMSLSGILALLVTTEILWRTNRIDVEVSRKIVHMGAGVIIAFWPLYISWTAIQLMSLVLLLVVLVSYKLNVFQSIHAVDRLTKGEILFPIGIGICALLEPAPWIFTAAILHLALADGLAAIVGVKYGKKTRYTLLSHGKSLIGSATFFAVSLVILTSSMFFISHDTTPALLGWFVWSALALTLIENISWYGLDDVTVPVSVIIILTVLPT